VWTAVLWSLCGAGIALAQEKTEAATEAKPAAEKLADQPTAAEPPAVPSAQKAEEPAPPTTEAPKAAEPAPTNAPETAPAKVVEEEKTPAAKAGPQAPFQASWKEASPDEKALYLESFGESSKVIRERWDKATPDERKRTLRWHPLLSARPLKQHWVSATPEERAAFLEVNAKMVQKVKEAWDSATPEQRKMLALEHPYFARKALFHAWMQSTPQEKIAFLVAHPSLSAELKARWTGATAWQKQWYAKNYPGLESVANGKPWADTTTEERALFLEANQVIAEKAREAWQKTQPEMRATLVKKWQGWPLRAYNAKLEKASKPLVSAKTRPPATPKKVTATSAKK
jgi:hypothetical protein